MLIEDMCFGLKEKETDDGCMIIAIRKTNIGMYQALEEMKEMLMVVNSWEKEWLLYIFC